MFLKTTEFNQLTNLPFSKPSMLYAMGDQWRNNSRKNEDTEPKQKQYPAVDVARSDAVKDNIAQEPGMLGL